MQKVAAGLMEGAEGCNASRSAPGIYLARSVLSLLLFRTLATSNNSRPVPSLSTGDYTLPGTLASMMQLCSCTAYSAERERTLSQSSEGLDQASYMSSSQYLWRLAKAYESVQLMTQCVLVVCPW